jgi:hypothetical protein
MKSKTSVSKVMLVALPVIMLALLGSTAFGVTAWITPDTSKYDPCDTFWVNVEVDDVTSMVVQGVGIVVRCDSSELEMLDATASGCLPAKWGSIYYEISDGKDTIRVATAGAESLVGAGCLAKIQFHMKECHGPGYVSTIHLDTVKLNETNVTTSNGYCLVPLVNVWVDTIDAKVCDTTKLLVYVTDTLLEGQHIDSIYIELTFDTTYVELVPDTAVKGALLDASWIDTFDLRKDSLHIWLSDTSSGNTHPPCGTGVICTVFFHVDTTACHSHYININMEHAIFDGVDPSTIMHDGALHAWLLSQIWGEVYYHANTAYKVPGCTVTAYGQAGSFPCPPFEPDTVPDVTGSNGQYTLGNLTSTLRRGDYRVCPSKSDYADNTIITAYDAALILMWWVDPGAHPLTANQQIAGDVSGASGLTPYDAGLILLWWVNYPNGTFPAGAWAFIPECTLFVDLWEDPQKDFAAIPIGDVSNNWTPPTKSIMSLMDSEGSARIVSLNGILGEQGTNAVLSVNIDDATDIVSTGITMSYDPNVLKPLKVSTADLTSGYMIADNIADNQIRIALAGGKPLSGSGSLANIDFQMIKTVGDNAISSVSISGVQLNGGRIRATTESQISTRSIPKVFALSQNYPNPVSGATDIRYQLPVTCKVDLKIYNLTGRLVRTLVSDKKQAGYYIAHWDGKDDLGDEVASGVYFYRIKAANFEQTKRLVILK